MRIKSKRFDPVEVEFLCLLPHKGVYRWSGKNYYSPLVLVEKYEKIKNRNERMDLKDLFVIPGYFLDKAIQIMRSYDYYDKFENEKDLFKYMLSSNLSTVIIGTKTQKISNGDEKIYLKVPSLFELDDSNPLLTISNTRKVVYHGNKVKEMMRYPHKSHLGFLDPLETPESEEIGLSLFLSYKAEYDARNLRIATVPDNVKNLFGYSTLSVPFLRYNDTPRAMMGGKNLKQAIEVVDREMPLIRTGIEEEIGFNFGINAFVGYALFNGLNFEDGIVVSRSFAEKMKIDQNIDFLIEDEVPLPIEYKISEVGRSKRKFSIESLKKDDSKSTKIKVVYEFQNKERFLHGDLYLTRKVYKIVDEKEIEVKNLEKKFFFHERYAFDFKEIKPQNFEIEELAPPINKEKFSMSHLKIKVPVRVIKPLDVGDKITGRYGNKGTISKVVEDEMMPYVQINGEKKHLDIVLSPFSTITRMNLGQLIETQCSLTSEKDGSLSHDIDANKILSELKKIGSENDGKFPLHMINEDGEIIFNATVGYQYFVRLDHCVRDKLHVIGKTNHISNITFQPYKGRKNDGGQRIGEMEFWTLFDHKAISLIELFAKTNLFKWKDQDEYLGSFNALLNAYHNFMIRAVEKDRILFIEKSKNAKENEEILKIIKDQKGEIDKYKEAKFLISKNGFPRKAMLGRRIHYSGRATIVPATDIDINHAYIPVDFALEWLPLKFHDVRSILEGDPNSRRELSKMANDYCKTNEIMILLNRQPSLHLHSIQSFYPIFWENYAIGLPLMVCEGFGADFDGDTMAVYYPSVQDEKIKDQMRLMLPSRNLFRAGNREIALSLSQDIAYGNYILDEKSVLSEKVKNIALYDNAAKVLLDLQKKLLKIATVNNLSVSFFEAKKGTGDMKKVENSKARGKEENFNAIHGNIKIGDESAGNFSKGIPLNFYAGVDIKNFDDALVVKGRKSMLDKKLHVAEAGYFTRKMVEFLYPLRITSEDCHTNEGLIFKKEDIEEFKGKYEIDRLINGRYIKFDQRSDWLLVNFNNLDEIKKRIKSNDFKELILRSPVTCKAEGLCVKCCGLDPAKANEFFAIGSFIGVRSGHSIGERGTQLSMKTFQTSKSDFKMSAVSSRIFRREEENFVAYLLNLANEDINHLMTGENSKKAEYLLNTIDISSLYLEVLFSYMKKHNLKKESDVKKFLSNFEEFGFFSSLSFENPPERDGIDDESKIPKHSTIAKRFSKIDKKIEEKSPKAVYALLPDKVGMILDDKKD